MEYFVCEAQSPVALRDEVNRFLAKGWRPLGGVAVICSPNSGTWWYYQALLLGNSEARAHWEELA
jgi:hypothetical protein